MTDTQMILAKIDEGNNALHQKIDESVAVLNEKIDKSNQKLHQKIDNIDFRLNGKIDELDSKLSGRIDELDSRLSGRIDSLDKSMNGRMDLLFEKVYTLEEDVKEIKENMMTKADKEELLNYFDRDEKRMTILEQEQTAIKNRVSNHEERIETLEKQAA